MDSAIKGTLTMQVPDGWKVEPLQTPFSFCSAGQKNNFTIKISMPAIAEKVYTIQAVATANSEVYTHGSDLITHRDLDQAILYHPAVAIIKGINVNVERRVADNEIWKRILRLLLISFHGQMLKELKEPFV